MPTLVEEEIKNDFPRMGVIAAIVKGYDLNLFCRKERIEGKFQKFRGLKEMKTL